MSTITVNISFQDRLLQDIDRVAKAEDRSRSELLREAARTYIQHKDRWTEIFRLGGEIARKQKLTPDDVFTEISVHRKAGSTRA